MKDFRNLVEAKETIVFTFGRFNPPTIGHEKLIKKVSQVAGSNPYQIYPSFTTNPKKDPLPHALKVAYMRKMFKKYAKNIIADKDSKTAINIAVKLYDKGYKNLVMVAGSDRIKEFDTLLGTYNGVEGKRHGYYKFDSIKVVSAGERDPDAEGVEGMSASKMRAAAVDGDYDSFSTGIPATLSDTDKKKLYRDVRKYMGIREERDMGDMSDFETLRDAYLVGQIWNVGDIVEANDIRGEVIRKGANYLSYVDENNKVHKAWLHDIILEDITKRDLDQIEKYADKLFGVVGIDVEFTRHFMDRVNDARNKAPITTSELVRLFKQSFKKYGKKIAKLGPDAEAVINDMKTNINMPFVLDLKGGKLELIAKTVMRKKDFRTSGPKLAFEELSERNYRKEYDNYQGRPEQIARRSSRNKARRVMGDKTKIGMDVGHKDNDPMNNDPENLRNENPSKNRREPRLRGKEEIDELSSAIPWIDRAVGRINQITHPKGYEQIVKVYVDGMKDDDHRRSPSKWATDLARRYKDVEARDLILYINRLVKKGKLPKELKADYGVSESLVKEEFEFFPKNVHERIKLPTPPTNLQEEADKLKQIIANRTPEDEESIKVHDKNSFYAIEKYCESNNLVFHNTEMKDIVLQAKPTIGYFKDSFDIARPHKVDSSIKPMSSVTSNTPAYPSGHACQSMLVALYVSSKFPEHERGVKEAAKECGLGRVKGGFHYLADYVAGNILAEKMFLVMNRNDYGKQINEVKQDKDIKDREGTQPAKYYAKDTEGDTMSKSTKQARATHFKKKKEGPAPGDASATTKPSTHTKKFKQMYGEVKNHKTDYETFVKMYAPLNKAVDDASAKLKKITSKNKGAMGLTDPKVKASPEFKKAKGEYEKSVDLTKKFLKGVPKDFLKKNAQSRRLRREEVELDEKRAKKAVAGGKVQKLVTAHGYSFKGKNYKEIDMELVKIDNSSQMVTFNIIHPAEIFGNEMKIPFKNLRRGRYMATDTSKINNEVLGKDADMGDYIDDFAKSDSPQFKGKSKEKRKEMAIAAYLSKNEEFELNEKIEGLVTKAEKSGMPYGILKKVYDRGMAAYKTGHRPGTTAQQWAFARVNSFVTKSSGTWGKADADLAKQVRGESVKEETPCWSGFKQVGMKTKGGKQVPNCVPEETTTEACCDDCDDLYDHVIVEAEYQGKKVKLNDPIRTSENPNKKFKVYTMGPSGKVVVVRFGDPNMSINRDDPKARAAFRSRHSCDEKKDKTTAGYWSCYQWRASSKVDN